MRGLADTLMEINLSETGVQLLAALPTSLHQRMPKLWWLLQNKWCSGLCEVSTGAVGTLMWYVTPPDLPLTATLTRAAYVIVART